jgi:hypothetical protein
MALQVRADKVRMVESLCALQRRSACYVKGAQFVAGESLYGVVAVGTDSLLVCYLAVRVRVRDLACRVA